MNKLIIIPIIGLTACGPQLVGPVGPPGPQGLTGQPGQNGEDGRDASGVTVVQLCPGTTTYPNVFVEVAFCASGKLYAVYSANGGFQTEIVPGTYQSNAVGSSCTFTVQPNCVVTH